MAISHLQFSQSTQHASALRSGLQGVESGRETLIKSLAKMQTMLNGDGTAIAHFDEVVIRYGVLDYATGQAVTDAQRAVAMSLYAEMVATVNKLTAGGVDTVLSSIFNKTR